ncbi:MAG: universal stress protein [Chloroflexota bacterium]|nr:universal stress protein [Chloroflexota bacterium]
MLVPIDGTHASATVIPYAATVAQRLGCRVDLLLVEPTSGARPPHPEHHRQPRVDVGEAGNFAVAPTTPEHVRQANERYVARHVEEFEALGVSASGQVVCGDAVEQILGAALELRSDVIAMATRKMSNYSKKETGSISEEVLWRSKLPVLLVAHG